MDFQEDWGREVDGVLTDMPFDGARSLLFLRTAWKIYEALG